MTFVMCTAAAASFCTRTRTGTWPGGSRDSALQGPRPGGVQAVGAPAPKRAPGGALQCPSTFYSAKQTVVRYRTTSCYPLPSPEGGPHPTPPRDPPPPACTAPPRPDLSPYLTRRRASEYSSITSSHSSVAARGAKNGAGQGLTAHTGTRPFRLPQKSPASTARHKWF